jgi:hypothetical protein
MRLAQCRGTVEPSASEATVGRSEIGAIDPSRLALQRCCCPLRDTAGGLEASRVGSKAVAPFHRQIGLVPNRRSRAQLPIA